MRVGVQSVTRYAARIALRARWHLLPLLALYSVLSGCASVTHGALQTIRVESDPSGARFTVDRDPVPYTTPTSLNLSRKEDHRLLFSREGYEDYNVDLTRSTSGALFGNILVGGLIGVAADYSSGAAYTLGHANLAGDVLTVRLTPRQPAPAEAKPGSQTSSASERATKPAIGPGAPATDESTTRVDDIPHDGSSDAGPQR